MLSVETVTDPRRFSALREEWTELLADSPGANPFLSWEWLHSWWAHLGAPCELRLMLVRRGLDLVAIAPLALRPGRAARLRTLPFDALEFLGTGKVGSDYLDVIVRRGEAATALPALAARLAEQHNTVEFSQ